MIVTDCSDIANGCGVLVLIAAAVGGALGWWIQKAVMLEKWRKEHLAERKSHD